MTEREELELLRREQASLDRKELEMLRREQGDMPLQALAQDTGAGEAALIGAGRTFNQIGAGVQDLYYRATGDDEARADLAREQAFHDRAYGALSREHPVATAVGETVPYLAVPGAGSGAGLASRVGTEAAIGGSLGGLSYGDTVLGGATTGAAGGVAGAMLGRGLQKLAGDAVPQVPPPEHSEMLAEAAGIGYRTTPAQRLGTGQLEKVEAGLMRHPLTSAPFDRLASANQETVNKIARDAIGATPEGKVTDAVLEAAHERIGKQYQALTPKNHAFDLATDPSFFDDLGNIDAEFMQSPVRGDQWPKFRDQILDLINDPLSLARYQHVASELAKKAKQVGRGDNADPALERALYGVREALDDAFERSVGPDALEQLLTARRQYRTLKILEKPGVVKNGEIRVGPLRNVLKREGKGRVRGSEDLARAAKVGEYFAPRVPSSGTAEGMAFQSMIESPIQSTLLGLGGNALSGGYMRSGGALGGAANIGQSMANVIGGPRNYLSLDQLLRANALTYDQRDSRARDELRSISSMPGFMR